MWLTHLLLAALPVTVQQRTAGIGMAMVVWPIMQPCDSQNADCIPDAT